MKPPRLVVGLGNPGAEHEDDRHNAGFWFVEHLARLLKVPLTVQGRFHGLVGRAGDVWLLCPGTYMNRSGQAVAALARFYKIEPDEVLVVHDELDLPPGGVRLKLGGGNAGHNGLKDISAHFSGAEYWRLRLGIGHPGERSQVSDYVLHRPRSEEQEAIDETIKRCLHVWSKVAVGDYTAAMAQLHGKPGAPQEK